MVSRRESEKFRFFILDDEENARSSCWIAREASGSFYLAPRATGRVLKLSFHPEGQGRDGCDSQFGFTRTYIEQKARKHSLPLLARWKRPTPKEGMAVRVASILFPTDFLRQVSMPPAAEMKRKFAIPLAAPGMAIEIGVFFARCDLNKLGDALSGYGVTAIGGWNRVAEPSVLLSAKAVPFDPAMIPDLNSGAQHPLDGAPSPGEYIDDASALLMLNRPDDGEAICLANISGLKVSGNI